MNKQMLAEIMQDSEKCEVLAMEVLEQIHSESESLEDIGRALLKARIDNNADDMLCALCGWTLDSLLARAGLIPDIKGVYIEEE